MRFILSLTQREIRSSWRRLLFFFLCIALGVGSVVALRSLIQNLTQAVGTDARALMTADLEVSTTNDFAPDDLAKIEEIIAASPIVEERNETISAAVMARPADRNNLRVKFVELKGIEPPFPLVGSFTLADGAPFDYGLLAGNGAVIARILTEDLRVNVGDSIQIGEGTFVIRGIIEEEPGGSSGFRLGGRVFIEKKAFDTAGLTRTARVRRRILYRTSDNPTELVGQLRAALKGSTVTIGSYREQQENLSEQFVRTENYLALSGLLILVLGGLGVWNVARAFVEQKRKTVAVLKCLGASAGKILSVYVLQIFVLGLVGSLFGVLLAQLGLYASAWRFADVLPEKMTYEVGLSTAIQGLVLGVVVSLLFSALPLLQIQNIKPKLLLRDENNASVSRLDRRKWLAGLAVLGAMLGVAVWQAGSLKVGAIFLVGLAVTSAILYLAATVLTMLLRRVRGIGNFTLRQSVNSLYRPGNQTRIILLAVGLGAFVVLATHLTQANILREFDFTRNAKLPSLFFVDIQKSQIDELAAIVSQRVGEQAQVIPAVRARIAFVNAEPFNFQDREVRREQGRIGREFAVTYRDRLEENETVIAGEWWNGAHSAEPQVSVEQAMATTLNVVPGDSITFDVSGRMITARVMSTRKINLRNSRSAFVFVFRPGTLEKAPQTYAASVLKHTAPTERQRLQRDLLDKFPNVQIFDVDDILTSVRRLIENFVLAITFVGGFVMLSGILILIGSIALTKSQRIYENAVLKTLGAKRFSLGSILVAEYGLVGFLAGLIGAAFAVAMSWVISRFVMNIDWEFSAGFAVLGVVVTTLIVVGVGLAASFDVLFRKPLATLRGG
jgi:putative ABC transport system permease protein